MKSTMQRAALAAVSILFAFGLSALAGTPDATTIIQQSIAANQHDWKASPKYSYFVRVEEGGSSTKTYRVLMILGSPYQRLVAVDDEPLSPSDNAAQQRKLEGVLRKRQAESQQDRAYRIAKYQKDRERNRFLFEQLTKALRFQFLGKDKLDGFNVYVLAATPRPGYHPPNPEARVLTGMQGNLWIDQNSFQWVKVEAKVVRPVSIDGFLARVEPGTRFELEKMPVGNGVWLPKHFAMRSRARILSVFTMHKQEDDFYSEYKKQDH